MNILNLLEKVLVMDTYDLFITIASINSKNYKVISDDNKCNYVVFIPYNCNNIGIVSHIDTVGTQLPTITQNNYTISNTNSNSVLGGDDRCGVAIALKTFLEYESNNIEEKPMFLFFNFEETSSMGASQFLIDYMDKLPELFAIKYFIGLDRQGYNEYVVYNPLDFKSEEILSNYCNSFGLYEKMGSTSDVRILSEILNIPSFNISVGYYNQHTSKEYIDKLAFVTSYNRLLQMLKNPITEKLELEVDLPIKCNTFNYGLIDDTYTNWDYIPDYSLWNGSKKNKKKSNGMYFRNRWY